MRRSLALLSEGMLSSSAKRTITIASIGWLVVSTPSPPIVTGGGSTASDTGFRKREYLRKLNEGNLIILMKAFIYIEYENNE